MTLIIVLFSLANATETPAEESARLLMERGVYATRLAEIDQRLAELGITVPAASVVPEKPAYMPSFKVVKVSPSFNGSDKVADILRGHQDEFAACWALGEHKTGISAWIGDGGRVEYNRPILIWPATKNASDSERADIAACYAGVLKSVWDFPLVPLPPPNMNAAPADRYMAFDPVYRIEILFG